VSYDVVTVTCNITFFPFYYIQNKKNKKKKLKEKLKKLIINLEENFWLLGIKLGRDWKVIPSLSYTTILHNSA